MIIIGYQGIGKSTLANKDINYIDLESGNFWIDGKRHEDWYIPYCNIANHLSKQGKNVFISSHEVVRNELLKSNEKVVVVFPSINLKEQWLDKLELRYKDTHLDKDYKALMNAKDRYIENINELKNNNYIKIEIDNINYDLAKLLESEMEEQEKIFNLGGKE